MKHKNYYMGFCKRCGEEIPYTRIYRTGFLCMCSFDKLPQEDLHPYIAEDYLTEEEKYDYVATACEMMREDLYERLGIGR